jgi:hypothetical protein
LNASEQKFSFIQSKSKQFLFCENIPHSAIEKSSIIGIIWLLLWTRFISYACIYFIYYLFGFFLKRIKFYNDDTMVRPFLPLSNTSYNFNYMSRYSVAKRYYNLKKHYKTRTVPQNLAKIIKKCLWKLLKLYILKCMF